jgi:hypothetical protein
MLLPNAISRIAYDRLMELKKQVAESSPATIAPAIGHIAPEDTGIKVEIDMTKPFHKVAEYCHAAIKMYLENYVLKEGFGWESVEGYTIAPHAYNSLKGLLESRFCDEVFYVTEEIFKEIINKEIE